METDNFFKNLLKIGFYSGGWVLVAGVLFLYIAFIIPYNPYKFSIEEYQMVYEDVCQINFSSGGLEDGVLSLYDQTEKLVYENTSYPLNSWKTMMFEKEKDGIHFLKIDGGEGASFFNRSIEIIFYKDEQGNTQNSEEVPADFRSFHYTYIKRAIEQQRRGI